MLKKKPLNFLEEAQRIRELGDSPSDYQYAIVFPNRQVNLKSCQRITYGEALELFLSCVNGGESKIEQAKTIFQDKWSLKFRCMLPDVDDLVPFELVQELIRQIIVSHLESLPGLCLSMRSTRNGNAVVCMIRGTASIFATEAQRIQLRMEIWPEVDPGFEYWSKRENIMRENKEINREMAQTLLYRMFLEGHISSEEAQIFPDENDFMWTNRINVLRRRLGDPSFDSKHCNSTFFPYKTTPKLQHLYKQIQGNSSRMPFQIVDKLRLMKSILDREYNLGKLQNNDLILSDFCLHTYSVDNQDACLENLKEEWGSLAAPFHLVRSKHGPWINVFNYQPLHDIRNYFGEEIALYFDFLGFFAQKISYLLVFGFFSFLIKSSLNPQTYSKYNLFCAFINCMWSIVFIRLRERREKHLAIQWGTLGSTQEQGIRSEFKGKLHISPITNREELFFHKRKRTFMQWISWGVLVFCILAMLVVVCGIFHLEYVLHSSYEWQNCTLLCHVVLALLIPLFSNGFYNICHALNNWENYKFQDDYDRNLTLKYTVCHTMNQYGALLFLVFLKGKLYGCNLGNLESDNLSCKDEVQHLLLIIFFLMFLNCFKSIVPSLVPSWLYPSSYHPSSYQEDNISLLNKDEMEVQLNLLSYEGVIHEYAEVMILFGYLCLFGNSSIYAPLVTYVLCLVQLRVDSHKLCYHYRRPFPKQTEDMAGWEYYLFALSSLGIFVNSGIAVLTSELFQHFSSQDQFLYFILSVFGMAACWGLVVFFIPSTPSRVHIAKKRQEYLQDKHIYGFENQENQVEQILPHGTVLLNGMYRHYVTGSVSDENEVKEIQNLLSSFNQEKMQQTSMLEQVARASSDALGKIHLFIIGINILPKMERFSNALDPYVHIYVGEQGKKNKHATFKTTVKKKNKSPIWKEHFVLPILGIANVIQMTIYDKEVVGKDRKAASCSLPLERILSLTEDTSLVLPLTIEPKLIESMQQDILSLGPPALSLTVRCELSQLGKATKRLQEINCDIAEHQDKLLDYVEW